MTLRDELLAQVGPRTHIADICGRAADELMIKEMKIEQQDREIERLRNVLSEMQGHTFFCQDPDGVLRRWHPPAPSGSGAFFRG